MPISQVELPTPADAEQALSRELQSLIRRRIEEAGGSIGFDQFMELALYAPGLGYYSAGQRKFGAQGDFTTAPELGSLFAECLAARLAPVLRRLEQPSLLELGPGSGALMRHLLPALQAHDVRLQHYWLLERSAECRRQQRDALVELPESLAGRVSWLESPPTQSFEGVVLGNEIIDALPAKSYRRDGSRCWERRVGIREGGFEWLEMPPDSALSHELETRWNASGRPPDGFLGEVHQHLPAWLNSVTGSLRRGVVFLIDYGYPRSTLYTDAHAEGTVVCHYRHRVHHDPFWWPGVQDISTFVDFTAVAEAGAGCGLELAGYTSQAGFLITACPDRLEQCLQEANETDRYALAREFRRLCAPEEMGERFQVMALTRGLSLPTRDWVPDWRVRL